jgi:hypothetical protein
METIMQSFDDIEMKNDWKSIKTSTKFTLLAGVLVFLVGLTLLAVNGQYVDVEQAVASAPETPDASFAISQTQRSH